MATKNVEICVNVGNDSYDTLYPKIDLTNNQGTNLPMSSVSGNLDASRVSNIEDYSAIKYEEVKRIGTGEIDSSKTITYTMNLKENIIKPIFCTGHRDDYSISFFPHSKLTAGTASNFANKVYSPIVPSGFMIFALSGNIKNTSGYVGYYSELATIGTFPSATNGAEYNYSVNVKDGVITFKGIRISQASGGTNTDTDENLCKSALNTLDGTYIWRLYYI